MINVGCMGKQKTSFYLERVKCEVCERVEKSTSADVGQRLIGKKNKFDQTFVILSYHKGYYIIAL